MMKEDLKKDFVENNCEEMWKEMYDCKEATIEFIFDDCFARSDAIMKLEEIGEEITELERRFACMVEGWV